MCKLNMREIKAGKTSVIKLESNHVNAFAWGIYERTELAIGQNLDLSLIHGRFKSSPLI